ncbi:MAG: MFS transporter [Lachnospiraceae bacterium]|nr:MFS transporter [Lachnospiraceae bacterium]
MKLKTGQTIRVGFAFLSICAFWQMYNNIIPLILTNTFHMNETVSGAIMAADNVLAIFLLPLFGSISDRCKSSMGRRKPFILYGTLISVALMVLLPTLDNLYYQAPATPMKVMFVVVLGCILVAMGTYRSPAVALMPDVTPKPLRSKANAIINLMGAIGGILYLIIATVLYSEKRTAGQAHVDYLPLFLIVGGIMLIGLFIVMVTVDEVKLNQQMKAYEAAHPEEILAVADESGEAKLPAEVKRSLGFLLASIALWFISYNAMETWFTTYANRMWNMSLGSASLCLTIATLGAIVSYIPVGSIASRIGRKKTILGGVILMTICFAICFVYTLGADSFHPGLYVVFVFIGMGWAAINVNSLPMVVEMCKGSDIGKFTGYYYTFSMAAQIVTPIVAGTLMNRIGYTSLFPYAALFMAAALVTMLGVKHGDSRLITKKGLEAYDIED